MRKMTALGLSLLLSGMVFGQEEEKIEGYLIEGQLSGQYTGKVYLTKEDGIHGRQTNIDSCEVIDGKYTFKGPKIDVVTMYFVKSKDGQLTPVFLENGRIRISGRADNFLWADVRGTLNNDIFSFHRLMDRYVIDSMVMSSNLENKRFGRGDYETENRKFKERSVLVGNKKLQAQRYLVDRFNDQPYAPFIILFEMVADVSTDELKALRAKLDPVLNDHPYTKALEEFIEHQTFQVGSTAYQFELKSIDGDAIKLHNYNGKYVFLDFWASWCGPCRREIPNVAKMYKALKGKDFEVIGISIDNKEDAWKNAVKEMKMTWPQACDLEAWNSIVARKYAVQSIPRTVLIDPEGKVIGIDLRGEDLTAKVKELIKKK